jgi:hypothetical protein
MGATRIAGEPARLADSPADYARFGLVAGRIDPWEDGLRLDTGAPNIEWWYFDSLLDDGAKLAVVFCTKDASRPHQPLEPLIEIDLDLPDGRRLMRYGRFKADEFSASKDGCDVRLGQYRFAGDLHEYTISAAAEDVSVEVRLEATTEPWRPATGHIIFGPRGEAIFAWTPFVPMGTVTAEYRIGSELHRSVGTGYHDHNWMTQEMAHVVDHWYWGRGQVGPYAFVTAYITTAGKYGYATVPLYMLARDGKVVADDGSKVTFSRSGSEVDAHTGKVIPDELRFEYRDGDRRDVLTCRRERTLVSQKLLDLATGLQKVLAEIVRYPGGYLRFAGPVTLERYLGDELIERHEATASFEQSYLAREIHGDQ